jgi:hypothetical protein
VLVLMDELRRAGVDFVLMRHERTPDSRRPCTGSSGGNRASS